MLAVRTYLRRCAGAVAVCALLLLLAALPAAAAKALARAPAPPASQAGAGPAQPAALAVAQPVSPTNTFLPAILLPRDRTANRISLADDGHACMIDKTGRVQCWGNNNTGQVGLSNTITYVVTPVRVAGLNENAVAIATGNDRWRSTLSCYTGDNLSGESCAVTAAGRLACWGGFWGLAGNVVTVIPTGVKDVALSSEGGCALRSDQTVQCWQYPDPGVNSGLQWTSTPGLSGKALDITAGSITYSGGQPYRYSSYSHYCALLESGAVQCWGYNMSWQLGVSPVENKPFSITLPITVPGLGGDVVQIQTVGVRTCALRQAGSVKCWGGYPIRSPQDVLGLSAPIEVLLGLCGLDAGGRLICWQGGDNLQAVVKGAPAPVVAYVANAGAECMTTSGGAAWCKGANHLGQLGDGEGGTERLQPVSVYGLSGAMTVAGGSQHACALLEDGSVQCWGENGLGSLGDGAQTSSTTPVQTLGVTQAVQISAGDYHACARRQSGGVTCWGSNSRGQAGIGQTSPSITTALPVIGLAGDAIDMAAGGSHTCAVLANGAVQCWGSNSWHEVNEAPEGDYSLPVTRSGLAGPARAVVAGVEYTCALLASGAVQCWGGNQYGQLGIGSTTLSETLPVTVTGLVSGVTSLAAGAAHTCAGLESGKVVCWGILEGVFLTATQGVQTTPLEMAGVDGFTALASGGFVTAYPSCPLFNQNTVTARTCALTQAGGVQCWSMGQAAPPTAPAGLEQGVRAIGLGGQFACAVLNTGGVRCWGRNDSGQLGNGNPISPFWVQAQLQP